MGSASRGSIFVERFSDAEKGVRRKVPSMKGSLKLHRKARKGSSRELARRFCYPKDPCTQIVYTLALK